MKIVGSSAHTEDEREKNDYYATDPQAVRDFISAWVDRDGNRFHQNIWEPACGEGNIAEVFRDLDHSVFASDLICRGYGEQFDFLSGSAADIGISTWRGDIVTNPPYKGNLDTDFIRRSLELVEQGSYVIMLFKVQFLASKKRKLFFEQYPIRYVYIHSSRIKILKNNQPGGSNALDYAWYVWQKGWTGDTVIKWI